MEHIQGTPGHMITRSGARLHHQVLPGPEGVPTVVFESGLAGTRSWWAAVQPAVAARTAVHDRPGYGRTPPAPRVEGLTSASENLSDLLDHLGPGPFVLVGHGWGGPIVRKTAAAAGHRVAGVVLVDPADEADDRYSTPAHRRRHRVIARRVVPLVRWGLFDPVLDRLTRNLPAQAAADLRAEYRTASAAETYVRESSSVGDHLCGLLVHPGDIDLGDIPVTVISGTRGGGRRRRALVAAHRHRASVSPNGRHVPATRSGHFVPFTEPALVAAEVNRLLGRER